MGLHAKAAAVKGGSSRGRPSIWMFRDSAPGPARCTHLARSSSWRCVSQLMTLSVVAATRFQSARGKKVLVAHHTERHQRPVRVSKH